MPTALGLQTKFGPPAQRLVADGEFRLTREYKFDVQVKKGWI